MQIANINGFDRILCDHDDGMIAKTIVYYNNNIDEGYGMTTEEGATMFFAYADKECTIKLTKDELFELFVKGSIYYDINADLGFGTALSYAVGCVVVKGIDGELYFLIYSDFDPENPL